MSAEMILIDTLDTYEESSFDRILRYLLIFGAVFQLICIAASILLPSTEDSDDESRYSFEFRRLHRSRKLDKKKRR